jgi:light-regulated signal transduction histidine kinase (bacteriophytochrome)
VLASVVDITERKNTERALKVHADQLERQNKELDQFTYLASHDLQEPLRKLVSFSALLEHDIGGDLPEKARKDMGFITDAAGRMQNLVRDLLALCRAGRADIQQKSVSLQDCVQWALTDLETKMSEAQAKVEQEELPNVCGNVTLLTQLYQNLISNAIKYRSAQRDPVVRLTAERSGDGWILGVKDNGIGIKPDYLEQIFAPFKRLHGRSEYEGTGIGLAICRTAVERHGGRIWVESEFGAGSHFKFTLAATCWEKARCMEELAARP